jgi:hypothetical protein
MPRCRPCDVRCTTGRGRGACTRTRRGARHRTPGSEPARSHGRGGHSADTPRACGRRSAASRGRWRRVARDHHGRQRGRVLRGCRARACRSARLRRVGSERWLLVVAPSPSSSHACLSSRPTASRHTSARGVRIGLDRALEPDPHALCVNYLSGTSLCGCVTVIAQPVCRTTRSCLPMGNSQVR